MLKQIVTNAIDRPYAERYHLLDLVGILEPVPQHDLQDRIGSRRLPMAIRRQR